MANPRKFSEKIALHNQKQAEETAAFEQIMREVMGATRTSHGQDNMQTYATSYDSSYIQQAANGAYPKHQLSISPSLGAYRGGSLPNVNQMSGGPAHTIDLQGALSHLEDMRHGREGGGPPSVGGAAASAGAAAMLPDRPHVRERGRHATAPHKGGRQMAFDKRADVSPYNSSLYLSPPPDTSWRRTNSDSALHQSAQAPQESFPGAGPSCGQRRGTDPVTARELDQMYRDCSARVDGFGQEILGLPDMNSMAMDNMNLKGYWDPKGGGGGDCYGNSLSNMGCGMSSHQQQQQHRPKSCDVPGINIYLPQDESGDGSLGAGSPNPSLGPQQQQQGMGHHPGNALQAPPPMGNGNTGSLPDLTSLHFPPPLATPLDPAEEMAQQQHQQSGQGPLPPLHPGQFV